MPGAYYAALSAMRSRLEALDRLASDIANSNTPGYKSERATNQQADRPSFGETLQSVIDVSDGPTRVDMRAGAVTPTGRDFDVAIDGSGFFEIATPAGLRYTRNGHFTRNAAGLLATTDGDAVQGTTGGPIKLGTGPVRVDDTGTVRANGVVAGSLKVVDFDPAVQLNKETASRFSANAGDTSFNVANPSIKGGALEQSNASIVERVAELASVSRNFESMQKAMSVLMNDVDGQAIIQLGRR